MRYIGLARTIYVRCTYDIFGRGITKYTVIYGVYIRFWPTLEVYFASMDAKVTINLKRLHLRYTFPNMHAHQSSHTHTDFESPSLTHTSTLLHTHTHTHTRASTHPHPPIPTPTPPHPHRPKQPHTHTHKHKRQLRHHVTLTVIPGALCCWQLGGSLRRSGYGEDLPRGRCL